MLGLLGLFGLVIGLVLVVVFFKIVLALLVWPFRALFWILGGLFLPFQLLGIAMLALVVVPVLLIGLPILLGIGVPVLLLAGLLFPLLLVVGGLLVLGRLFAGR